MSRSRVTPMGALLRGFVAGALGSLAQSMFFAATKKIAPSPPSDAFTPPEPEQREEGETQTVARRVVEDLMKREPIVHKKRAGQIVHYAYGGAWGALYGLLAASLGRTDARAGLAYGALVWLISDDLIVPAFKLGAWPNRYPLKTHAYALAAHLVYGAAVSTMFARASRR